MKEKQIEQKLVKTVKQNGGLALKFVSPGNDGVPDRLLLFPDGKAAFAELKAPGKTPRPLQLVQIRKLRSLGFKVFVIDDANQIPDAITEVVADEVHPS